MFIKSSKIMKTMTSEYQSPVVGVMEMLVEAGTLMSGTSAAPVQQTISMEGNAGPGPLTGD